MSTETPRKKKKKRSRIGAWWYRTRRRFASWLASLGTEDGTKKKKKKHHRKLRKQVIMALVLVAAIACAILIPRGITDSKLKNLGYTNTQIDAIRSQKLTSTILDNQYYSEYLAQSIEDGTLNTDYIAYYTVVSSSDGLDAVDFLLIGRLRDKGYEEDQILNLFENLQFWEITPLLVFDYQYDETAYISDCQEHESENSTSYFVLSGTYYTPYENTRLVEDSTNVNMLVNKTWYLDSSYIPANLTELDTRYASEGRSLAGVAAEALYAWSSAGAEVGVTFYAASAYRSYDDQSSIYNSYLSAYGQEETDAMSARPGFSEHQTGYTVDVAATNEDDTPEYKDTNAYQWTSTNSQDYGWILRYPEGKETITGYEFESWHYRYLGIPLAQAVYASEMTYDEFYMLYLKGWDDETCRPSDEILTASDWQTVYASAITG